MCVQQRAGGRVPAAPGGALDPRKYAITYMYKSKDDDAQWGYSWEMDQVTAAVHGFTTYNAAVQRVHHLLPTILLLRHTCRFPSLSCGGDAHRAPASTTGRPPLPWSSAGYGSGKGAASLSFRSADV